MYKSTLVFQCMEGYHKAAVTYTCEQTRKFETNETCTPVLCTEPDTTGYDFSKASKDTRSREVPTFDVRGVVCDAGYAGTPTYTACDSRLGGAYAVSGCTAVACPENSEGDSVPLGCDCKAGFSGSVSATTKAPFYDSTCSDVRCPANSSGTNVASGDCVCDEGWEGEVTASVEAPFYVSTCTPIVCTRPRDKVSVERYVPSIEASSSINLPSLQERLSVQRHSPKTAAKGPSTRTLLLFHLLPHIRL